MTEPLQVLPTNNPRPRWGQRYVALALMSSAHEGEPGSWVSCKTQARFPAPPKIPVQCGSERGREAQTQAPHLETGLRGLRRQTVSSRTSASQKPTQVLTSLKGRMTWMLSHCYYREAHCFPTVTIGKVNLIFTGHVVLFCSRLYVQGT